MASAWGQSWGNAWGVSWGDPDTEPPPPESNRDHRRIVSPLGIGRSTAQMGGLAIWKSKFWK